MLHRRSDVEKIPLESLIGVNVARDDRWSVDVPSVSLGGSNLTHPGPFEFLVSKDQIDIVQLESLECFCEATRGDVRDTDESLTEETDSSRRGKDLDVVGTLESREWMKVTLKIRVVGSVVIADE